MTTLPCDAPTPAFRPTADDYRGKIAYPSAPSGDPPRLAAAGDPLLKLIGVPTAEGTQLQARRHVPRSARRRTVRQLQPSRVPTAFASIRRRVEVAAASATAVGEVEVVTVNRLRV